MYGKILLAAAAAVGGYELWKHSQPASKRAGPGDTVAVDVGKLGANALPAALPAGTGQIAVLVGSADATTVTGALAGYVANGQVVAPPIGIPAQNFQVPRSAIVGIVSGGKVLP